MNAAEFKALPQAAVQPTERERASLMASARSWRQIAERAYRSLSGAEVADAPRHDLTADALACLGSGKDVEATIALFAAKWRTYATENNTKVERAPKTARGPRAGQSVIEHRWTNPEAFDTVAVFLRQMAPKGVSAEATP